MSSWSICVFGIFLLSACHISKNRKAGVSWTIELKKNGCVDVCDAYNIAISSDASYVYKGKFNVKIHGEKEGVLHAGSIEKLNEQMKEINWPSLDSVYGKAGSGPQMKILKVQYREVEKQIVYYAFEPAEIRYLEQIIDEIIRKDEF